MRHEYARAISEADLWQRTGRVCEISGLLIQSRGPDVAVGDVCEVISHRAQAQVLAEVVGLQAGRVMLMPYGDIGGITLGAEVVVSGQAPAVSVGEGLLGRVVDAFGRPLDSKGRLHTQGTHTLKGAPQNPLLRPKIQEVLETGVQGIDALLTVGRGQRMGIFAGSGVGKSTLLGMIARHMKADVNVIALIGERGREVLEFIDHNLGEEGLSRSVVVVATSDEPAPVRVRAAYTATAIAEYFQQQGMDVMLTMDSVTRFAMARREIGLSVGEPPTARGYTPSVFAELPKLLERCGTSGSGGSITALYTVLVDGDDMNDPVADALRSILDGHIVLSRQLATLGQYPAIDYLASVSRLMADIVGPDDLAMARQFLSVLSAYAQNHQMIDIGAYKSGTNPDVDKAIRLRPAMLSFIKQDTKASIGREQAMMQLRGLFK